MAEIEKAAAILGVSNLVRTIKPAAKKQRGWESGRLLP
jgi:hypothetical protein